MLFANHHYAPWRATRFAGVDKYISAEFLKGKTMIEVGGGNGHNGQEFYERGCHVHVTDARQEHLDGGKDIHPHLTFSVLNCEVDSFDKHYDICLHWGTLYHVDKIDEHMERVCTQCDYLFLEHECTDTDEIINVKVAENGSPHGSDQAYSCIGSRPSPNYIKMLFDKNGFEYREILDPIMNVHDYRYDWTVENTKSCYRSYRRFWIAWRKGMPSPLKSL